MEKIFDVLVIGELNVDLILNKIEKFPEIGKEVIANEMTLTLGSSSAIFASNISSMGAKTAFLGKIGKDKFGDIVLESFEKSKVDTSLIIIDPTVGTGATVVLSVDEDRANTTYPGAMNNLTINDIDDANLKKARHLHFSSYFLQPGLWGSLGILFKRAKQLGLTTSFDMQWDPAETWNLDVADVLPYVDVFLPNEEEIKCLTNQKQLNEAIQQLKPYTNILVVKRGNKGSMVYYQDQLTDLPPFLNEQVVDTTGAGDSFNAGFIYQFINGQSIADCQRFGNLTGAVSTTAAGGTAALQNYDNFKKTAKERFNFDI